MGLGKLSVVKTMGQDHIVFKGLSIPNQPLKAAKIHRDGCVLDPDLIRCGSKN